MFDLGEGDVYVYGPMKSGKWYVRPFCWAGTWDSSTGELISGNVSEETDTKDEAKAIAWRMNEEERNHVPV